MTNLSLVAFFKSFSKSFLNLGINWYRSQKFKSALKQKQHTKATKLLQEIIDSGAKLSLTEQLFQKQIKLEKFVDQYQKENLRLTKQLHTLSAFTKQNLVSDSEVIHHLWQELNITAHDAYHLQITGIDESVFGALETQIYDYLVEELDRLEKISPQFKDDLQSALDDINNLKQGKDPAYGEKFTPYVYLMKYFLDNTYTAYLAWLLIYQNGLLQSRFSILDLAAGPSTIAYSLDLLYRSLNKFIDLLPLHISYFSLEQKDALQYRGLQLWRKYMASQDTANNTYFQFFTADIFNVNDWLKQTPNNFFDFVVISHCFFSDPQKRQQSVQVYQQIFQHCLSDHGYVLLIIQDKKLFKSYDLQTSNNIQIEVNTIKKFLDDLGLNLVWYRYLSSTPLRRSMNKKEFGIFAKSLPKQKLISDLLFQYSIQNFGNHYVLDDYVILANLKHS